MALLRRTFAINGKTMIKYDTSSNKVIKKQYTKQNSNQVIKIYAQVPRPDLIIIRVIKNPSP